MPKLTLKEKMNVLTLAVCWGGGAVLGSATYGGWLGLIGGGIIGGVILFVNDYFELFKLEYPEDND